MLDDWHAKLKQYFELVQRAEVHSELLFDVVGLWNNVGDVRQMLGRILIHIVMMEEVIHHIFHEDAL